MRILIDLQGCQSGSRFGGIGRYSMSLAKAMIRLNSKHEFSLLLNSRLPNENQIRAEFADLMPQQNILTFDVPAFVAAENDLPTHTRMAEFIREKRIAEINPDLLHIASLFEGAGEDVVTSVGLLFPAERTAVTLYDLIPYLEQETYLTNQMLSDHYLSKFESLKRAGMVLSISDFSRTEALDHTDIPAERIANISSAVDGQFSPLEIDAASKFELLRKSGIDKPFLLFTGSFDSRKNHDRLVAAFAKIPPTLRRQYQLVIIGKGADDQLSRLRALGKSAGLNEQDIVFVGHVTDDDLVAFYNLCTLFVFPSLREGFGLPVLEAMSCGAATIGSNKTSIPEVIGRADALFDPEDVDDIAAKIAAVLSDPALLAELKRHGLDRAKHFSWTLSAERALAFFERHPEDFCAAESPRVHDLAFSPQSSADSAVYDKFLAAVSTLKLGTLDADFLESAARAIAANELRTRIETENCFDDTKIGWVTDWNVESETAIYSRRIMQVLQLQPTIFASHSEQMLPPEGTNVIRCWKGGGGQTLPELQSALANSSVDIVVIQYGNSMYELSALAALVTQQKSLKRHVFVTFHSTEALKSFTDTAGLLEIRGALKSCDGIFVHSEHDVRILEAFKVRKNVLFLPNPGAQPQSDRTATGARAALVSNYFFQRIAFAIANGI